MSAFARSRTHRLAGQAVLVGFVCLFTSLPAYAAKRPFADDIFRDADLLSIAIEIPEEGMERLKNTFAGRGSPAKPEVQVTVIEAGRSYTNVTAQLKGFTTFRPVHSLPSVTLNFHKLAPKQRFHGLTKISLNNSLQDPTRLHEKLSREVFAAAGVPVPRADYALVTLNGRELGLYVLTEGFDKTFLKRHFARADGTLYEGGILRDIDQSLYDPDGQASSHAAVQKLISASREVDADKRQQELEAVLDVDRFLSMMAVETILCHSDTYSMNRNNYRIYHDPSSGKLVFMPHGMDRVLGAHRSSLQLDIVPPALGMVARAVLSVPDLRARYIERAGVLFTNVFQPAQLCERVHEMNAKIAAAKTNYLATLGQFDGRMSRGPEDDADDLCRRITRRAEELTLQFANRGDWLALPPVPSFDSNGVAVLAAWKVRPAPGPLVIGEMKPVGSNGLLHLHTTNQSLVASIRSRMTLPPGLYRLTGQIKVGEDDSVKNSIRAYVRRHSALRYAIEELRFDWQHPNLVFQIVQPRAPEEVEFVCDIRSPAPQAWLDLNSLRLIREETRTAVPGSIRVLSRPNPPLLNTR